MIVKPQRVWIVTICGPDEIVTMLGVFRTLRAARQRGREHVEQPRLRFARSGPDHRWNSEFGILLRRWEVE